MVSGCDESWIIKSPERTVRDAERDWMRATCAVHSSRTRAPSEGNGTGLPFLMGWMVMRAVRGLIEETQISTGVEAITIGVPDSAARAGLIGGLINAMAPAETTALRASLRLNWSFIEEHSPVVCTKSLSFVPEGLIVAYLLQAEIRQNLDSAISAAWNQGGAFMVRRICFEEPRPESGARSLAKGDTKFIQQDTDCIQRCILYASICFRQCAATGLVRSAANVTFSGRRLDPFRRRFPAVDGAEDSRAKSGSKPRFPASYLADAFETVTRWRRL